MNGGSGNITAWQAMINASNARNLGASGDQRDPRNTSNPRNQSNPAASRSSELDQAIQNSLISHGREKSDIDQAIQNSLASHGNPSNPINPSNQSNPTAPGDSDLHEAIRASLVYQTAPALAAAAAAEARAAAPPLGSAAYAAAAAAARAARAAPAPAATAPTAPEPEPEPAAPKTAPAPQPEPEPEPEPDQEALDDANIREMMQLTGANLGVCVSAYRETNGDMARTYKLIQMHLGIAPSPEEPPPHKDKPDHFNLIDVSGDGNCLFHAIIKSIEYGNAAKAAKAGAGIIPEINVFDAPSLRQQTASIIEEANFTQEQWNAYLLQLSRDEQILWNQFFIKHHGDYNNTYKEFFSTNHAPWWSDNPVWIYASQVEARLVSRIIMRPISIWASASGGFWQHEGYTSPGAYRVFIRHEGNHYVTMIPENNDYYTCDVAELPR